MRPLNKQLNTQVAREDGCTLVIFHGTIIVKFSDMGITLNSGGWQTVTTKARMNQASKEYALGFYVYQHKGKWYVETKWDAFPIEFKDYMFIGRPE